MTTQAIQTRRSTDQAITHCRILLGGDPVVLVRAAATAHEPYFLTVDTRLTAIADRGLPYFPATTLEELVGVVGACGQAPAARSESLRAPVSTLVIACLDGVDRLIAEQPDKMRFLLDNLRNLPLDVILLCPLTDDGNLGVCLGGEAAEYVDMALLAVYEHPGHTLRTQAYPAAPWVVDHSGQLEARVALDFVFDIPRLTGLVRVGQPAPAAPVRPAPATRRPRAAAPAPAPMPAAPDPSVGHEPEALESEVDLEDEDEDEAAPARPPCGQCGGEISDDAWDFTTVRRQDPPLCGECGPKAFAEQVAQQGATLPRKKTAKAKAPAAPPPAAPPPPPAPGEMVASLPQGEVVGRIPTRDPALVRAMADEGGWTPQADNDLLRGLT